MEHIYTVEEIAKQKELDLQTLEQDWNTLCEQAGGGERGRAIVDAFKQLYTLYTPELAEWFAKLYDPAVGGYYSTTSGHDTEGFGPDVEVTVQSLRFIESSGMLREVGGLMESLPEGMVEAMRKFAKSLQNPNGYFYHPQWAFDDVHYSLARRGRDLGWATALLKMTGGTPTYDTPNGIKGDGLDINGLPVAPLVNCAGESTQEEKPAAAKNYPEYLENKDTFLEYLSKIDINANSYGYGNQFNATYSQIKARNDALLAEGADYSLCEILINWLNERINPNTGYWGEFVNLAGSNGFFKIITIYNVWGYLYPMPEKVTESVLHNIMGDEVAAGNCCSIYNLWSAICSIKGNVKLNPDEALRQKVMDTINETLRDRGAEAILNTYKKMIPYRKPGNAFSHSYTSCGGTQQGLYTGLNPMYGVLEGNVDATCICSSGLTRAMFDAFGFRKPAFLTKADWMRYKNVLMTYGPAKKIRVQNPLADLSGAEIPKYIRPNKDTSVSVADGKLIIEADECDKGISLFPTARICRGDFFRFEADLAIKNVTGDGKIRISNRTGTLAEKEMVTYLDLEVKDGKVSLGCEKWETGFYAKDVADADGFKLRLELYLDPMTRLDGQKNRKCSAYRAYVNGKQIGTVVNNDGREKSFPSGFTLGGTTRLCIEALGSSGATIELSNLMYSYATKQ